MVNVEVQQLWKVSFLGGSIRLPNLRIVPPTVPLPSATVSHSNAFSGFHLPNRPIVWIHEQEGFSYSLSIIVFWPLWRNLISAIPPQNYHHHKRIQHKPSGGFQEHPAVKHSFPPIRQLVWSALFKDAAGANSGATDFYDLLPGDFGRNTQAHLT